MKDTLVLSILTELDQLRAAQRPLTDEERAEMMQDVENVLALSDEQRLLSE